jgi:hypothetical protein
VHNEANGFQFSSELIVLLYSCLANLVILTCVYLSLKQMRKFIDFSLSNYIKTINAVLLSFVTGCSLTYWSLNIPWNLWINNYLFIEIHAVNVIKNIFPKPKQSV